MKESLSLDLAPEESLIIYCIGFFLPKSTLWFFGRHSISADIWLTDKRIFFREQYGKKSTHQILLSDITFAVRKNVYIRGAYYGIEIGTLVNKYWFAISEIDDGFIRYIINLKHSD